MHTPVIDHHEAFLQAYDDHADGVFRYFLLQRFSRRRALRCTQETFVRSWKCLRAGQTVEDPGMFLHTVAAVICHQERSRRLPAVIRRSLSRVAHADDDIRHSLLLSLLSA